MMQSPDPIADPAITIDGLALSYGALRVIHGVSLAIPRGAVTALIGPNGCGKSTLLKGLTRVLPAVGGTIHVEGRPEWVFVKIHTHGAPEKDAEVVLGPAVDAMFTHLEQRYNDGERFVLHYVNAREMFNIIKAAEAGREGDPNQYRDFVLPPPPNRAAAR